MKYTAHCAVVALSAAVFASSPDLHAQALVGIQTVVVGDAGNAADTTGYGSVSYEYNIGKYEVTISQYTTFLNAVAASDPYGLYSPEMATDLNIAGISRLGLSGSYSYSVIGSGARPVTYVSWFDAARFANWMNNGATNGASTETGAYTLEGATSGIFYKNPEAAWWIPSEDEWYKAAYYKGGGADAGYWAYPTQSDTMPGNTIGGATNQGNFYNGVYSVTQSPDPDPDQNYLTDAGAFSNTAGAYGTFDQAGNAFEWNDAVYKSAYRNTRGGSWYNVGGELPSSYRYNETPGTETDTLGFRLATIPEPSTHALLVLSAAGLCAGAIRRRCA